MTSAFLAGFSGQSPSPGMETGDGGAPWTTLFTGYGANERVANRAKHDQARDKRLATLQMTVDGFKQRELDQQSHSADADRELRAKAAATKDGSERDKQYREKSAYLQAKYVPDGSDVGLVKPLLPLSAVVTGGVITTAGGVLLDTMGVAEQDAIAAEYATRLVCVIS